MQKITTFLWFNQNAEEAVKYYISVFKKGKITSISHYGKSAANASGQKEGSVMLVAFELMGQEYLALNCGPHVKFNEAVSLVVQCKTQKEIDYYWKKLSAGGDEPGPCGWLKDKFGLSWQIVPHDIAKLVRGKNAAASERVMAQVMQMGKLDIKRMKKAFAGT